MNLCDPSVVGTWNGFAAAVPHRPALICQRGGHTVERTWAQFHDRSTRLAAVLRSHGTGRGSAVAAYLYDGNELLETCYGALALGARPLAVERRLTGEALARHLQAHQVTAVVYQGAFALRVWEIRERLPPSVLLLQVDDHTELPLRESQDYEQVLRRVEPMRVAAGAASLGEVPAEAPAELAPVLPVSPLPLPGMLWCGAVRPLLEGRAVVTAARPGFDPHLLWALAEEHHVGELIAAGDSYLTALLEALDAARRAGSPYHPAALRRVLSIGPMAGDLAARLQARLPVEIAREPAAG